MITVDLVRLAASQRAMPGLGQFDRERVSALMAAMESCNARFGRGAVAPAAAGVAPRRDRATKFERRSPRYTTRLAELPVIGTKASTMVG